MEAVMVIVCSLLLTPLGTEFQRTLPAGEERPPVATTRSTGPGPIALAVLRDAPKLRGTPAIRGDRPVQQPGENRRWMSRHPVLFGALVGAGAGAAYAGIADNELFCSGGDEDCLYYGGTKFAMGAAIGGGIGALVGLIVGLAR